MTTGEMIREARKKAGLTQSELGAMLRVTGAMISEYEKGKRNPKPNTLHRIAIALNTQFQDLIPDGLRHDVTFQYGWLGALEGMRVQMRAYGYTFSKAERELIGPFSKLDAEGQAEIIRAVLAMLEAGEHTRH